MQTIVCHVPLVYNDGSPVSLGCLERLFEDVIDIAGGLTRYPAEGMWKHKGKTFREPVVRIHISVADKDFEGLVAMLEQRLKTEFKQIAVYLELNGIPEIR